MTGNLPGGVAVMAACVLPEVTPRGPAVGSYRYLGGVHTVLADGKVNMWPVILPADTELMDLSEFDWHIFYRN